MSFTDAQWRHVLRIGRIAAPKPAPTPERTPLEQEAAEVEAQLDAILADPKGDRCLMAVEEAHGRADRIGRVLGFVHDGDDAPERIQGHFGLCGECIVGPARACPRCAAGAPHPGEPCDSPHRTRYCRGWSYLATLYARRARTRGDETLARDIERDIGLTPAAPTDATETTTKEERP